MADDNFDLADDSLDPFLQSFFDAEMAAPLASGSHERVLSGVLETLSTTPTAAATAAVSISKAVTLAIASAVLGVVIGILVERHWVHKAPAANLEKPISGVVIASPAKDAGAEPESAIDRLVSVPDAGMADASSKMMARKNNAAQKNSDNAATKPIPGVEQASKQASNPLEESTSPAAREAHLIDRARSGLRRGLIDEALLALMQHERKFPGGQLAEERDVLIIETYVAQGNTRIAKKRIQRYRNQHPKGFHRNRVNQSEQRLLKLQNRLINEQGPGAQGAR